MSGPRRLGDPELGETGCRNGVLPGTTANVDAGGDVWRRRGTDLQGHVEMAPILLMCPQVTTGPRAHCTAPESRRLPPSACGRLATAGCREHNRRPATRSPARDRSLAKGWSWPRAADRIGADPPALSFANITGSDWPKATIPGSSWSTMNGGRPTHALKRKPPGGGSLIQSERPSSKGNGHWI